MKYRISRMADTDIERICDQESFQTFTLRKEPDTFFSDAMLPSSLPGNLRVKMAKKLAENAAGV